MLKEKIEAFAGEIAALPGVKACALVTRDGVMLAKSAPEEFNELWFAMMSASLFSSAESLAGIIRAGPPEMVIVRSGDLSLLARSAGEKILIITVLTADVPVPGLSTSLHAIAGQIAEAI